MFNPETMPTIPADVRGALDELEDAAVDAGRVAMSFAKVRVARRLAESMIMAAVSQCQREAYEAGVAAGRASK